MILGKGWSLKMWILKFDSANQHITQKLSSSQGQIFFVCFSTNSAINLVCKKFEFEFTRQQSSGLNNCAVIFAFYIQKTFSFTKNKTDDDDDNIYKCTNKVFLYKWSVRELYALFIQSLFLFYNGCFNWIRHKGAFQSHKLSICHAMKVINDLFL